MKLEQILNQASDYELDYGVAVVFASSQKQSLVEFVNDFAITLAKGYENGHYDYEFGDGAANWLFGFMTDEVFLSSNNNTLPSPAYDVYLAFDEGEYHHRGDPYDVVAKLKYTKPRINEILSGNHSIQGKTLTLLSDAALAGKKMSKYDELPKYYKALLSCLFIIGCIGIVNTIIGLGFGVATGSFVIDPTIIWVLLAIKLEEGNKIARNTSMFLSICIAFFLIVFGTLSLFLSNDHGELTAWSVIWFVISTAFFIAIYFALCTTKVSEFYNPANKSNQLGTPQSGAPV